MSTRIIEVSEDGTLTVPADMLTDAAPHARYFVEASDGRLVVRPAQAEKLLLSRRKPVAKDWDLEWRRITGELSKIWPETVSVVDVISEMRR